MQNMHKLAIALLAAASIQGSLLAYRFTFSNHTAEAVMFRFNLAGDGTDYDFVLQPQGKSGHEYELWFKWIHEGITNWENNRRAGFCWSSIKMKRQMKDASGRVMRDEKGNPIWSSWKEVNVKFVESDKYQGMVDASDQAAAAIANIGLSAGGKESVGESATGIAKGIGSLVARSQCKNRHFSVVYSDRKGKDLEVTSLAD